MIRKTNTVPHPVMDKMRYSVPRVQSEGKSLVFFRTKPIGVQIKRMEQPKDFERMAFVLRACSQNPKQDYLSVLHVEQTKNGSRIVACDEHRLHVAEISAKIKSGDYKPVVTKDCFSLGEPVTGIMFPNWMRVIPGITRKRGVINLANTGMGKDRSQTERLSLAYSSFVKQTGELVNLRYLEDLTKTTWSLHCQSEKHKAVVLKEAGAEQTVFAVIMPLSSSEANAMAA
jgi:hypothetical protein